MSNYNDDDACPGSPGLEPVHPKATPSPSPPPFIPQQNPTKPSNRRTRPSQGDKVLISFMDANRPEIAHLVGEQALNSDSGSEADEEDMEEDIVSHSPLASSAHQTAGISPGSDLVGTAQAAQTANSRGLKDTASPPRRGSMQSDSEKFVELPCPMSKPVDAGRVDRPLHGERTARDIDGQSTARSLS
ncbi:uncharacterized protein BDZ99DRAFT_179226 [Mytilinidion resinicola]|uniref:Uncharacterized protein n=1 Tax=Mytilinidion resinicola TaxID=574789 RepID=A0A6A6Y3C5_9PEZI|nr:uncharacterized protein BDZ99DRAFT_179226 [Mytilinidion resinicola]KAF2803023.1 hypothetical protein BDZ99DRAFT_179226 [Mytilinidion resinicola]